MLPILWLLYRKFHVDRDLPMREAAMSKAKTSDASKKSSFEVSLRVYGGLIEFGIAHTNSSLIWRLNQFGCSTNQLERRWNCISPWLHFCHYECFMLSTVLSDAREAPARILRAFMSLRGITFSRVMMRSKMPFDCVVRSFRMDKTIRSLDDVWAHDIADSM